MSDPSLLAQSPVDWEEEESDLMIGTVHTWRIETLSSADRSLARIGVLEERRAQNKQIAEAARARIDAWEKKQNQGLDYGIALHVAKLAEFAEMHRGELLKGAKKGAKSRSLPFGRIGWRAKQERWEVTNKEELAAWALAKDPGLELGLVSVAPVPVMKAIRKFADETHAIPPGVVVAEPARDEFYATPITEDTALAVKEDE